MGSRRRGALRRRRAGCVPSGQPPCPTGRAPRFVKRYANLADQIRRALTTYKDEVRSGAYPAEEHTYAMPDEELELFDSASTEGVEHAHDES